jgi:hypothetical protein
VNFCTLGERNLDIKLLLLFFEPNANFLDNFAQLSIHKFEKKTPGPKPPWTQFVLLGFKNNIETKHFSKFTLKFNDKMKN